MRIIILILIIFAAIFVYRKFNANQIKYNRAVKYMQKGNYQKAENNLKFVVSHANNSKKNTLLLIDSYYLLGECYDKLNEDKKADEAYQHAIEEDTKERSFGRIITGTDYLRRGLAYIRLKEYNLAVDAFELGLEIANISCEQELLYNQVAAYEYLNDWANAKLKMEEYIEKYPDDENALNEWKFLKTR